MDYIRGLSTSFSWTKSVYLTDWAQPLLSSNGAGGTETATGSSKGSRGTVSSSYLSGMEPSLPLPSSKGVGGTETATGSRAVWRRQLQQWGHPPQDRVTGLEEEDNNASPK